MQPVNYLANLPDPFQGLGEALKLGLQIRTMREKSAQEEAAKAQQEQYNADIQAAMQAPTPEAFAALALKHPKQHEAYQQAWSQIDAGRRQAELKDGAELASMLQAGRPDLALTRLDDRIKKAGDAGQPTDKWQMLRDLVQKDPTQAYGNVLHAIGSLGAAGKDVLDNLTKLSVEDRAQQLQPDLVRKGAADASKAESDAAIADVNAKYAPQRVPLEVQKLGEDIGLTKAQIAQAKAAATASYASANNSNASAAKTRQEMQQGAAGLLAPAQRAEAEGKLRKEYSDQTKGFQDVREAYRRLKASDNNAVGDLSLIFGYMKMLDPGSVVREGEFANAQNAAGVPDRVANLYNRIISGERLNEGQRKQFIAQAGRLFDSAQKQEQTVRSGLERIATGYGLKKENIFYDPANTPEPGPPTPQPSAADVDALVKKYGGR